MLEGMKRVRAAALKHGRYSVIERELAALAAKDAASMLQRAKTTRDPLMRRVYAGLAVRGHSAADLDTLRCPAGGAIRLSRCMTTRV
jgi:hypothetical protein